MCTCDLSLAFIAASRSASSEVSGLAMATHEGMWSGVSDGQMR